MLYACTPIYIHTVFFCFTPALLLDLSLSLSAPVLLYSCRTQIFLMYILLFYSCFAITCRAVCVYIYSLLLLYSGLTYNMYNICNVGIYSCLESCRTKGFHIKAV